METELKLSLNAVDLPALRAHPLLAGPSDTQRLLNTYFDTPAQDLQRARMAVRERLSGRDWLLTVKTAGSSVDGLSRRQEWEGPTTPGELDFAALVDDAALDQGEVSVPDTALRAPILELELELLNGPDTALQALA